MKRSYLLLPLAVAVAAAAYAVPASANVLVNFPDFSSTAGLTLVGDTATTTTGDGAVLRIVPATTSQAGAAYSTVPVTLGGGDTFSTQFQFRFTNPGGIDPADGITFVLAQSASGLGEAGGGLGYAGVGNSVAIEFDTFDNAEGSDNHVGIDRDGALDDTPRVTPYGVASCGFSAAAGCMSNGDKWTVNIGYDGANLTVTVQDGSSAPDTVISSLPIDIASLLGTDTAFVGFTGSTGAGFENEDILNWRFADTSVLPPPVPEPASLSLLGLGVVVLAFARRRRT